MNATQNAQRAYTQDATLARTDRRAEYEIIATATRKLQTAGREDGRDKRALAEAIHTNRQLWSLLAADAAGDGNKLSAPLRASVISLAEFTRKHSSKVLFEGASVDTLVELNAALMRGLSGQGTTP